METYLAMSTFSETDERTPLLSARAAGVVEESSDFPHPATSDRPLGHFRVEIFSLLKHSVPGSLRFRIDSEHDSSCLVLTIEMLFLC